MVEVRDIAAISKDGENLFLELMNKRVRFRASGLFTRQVMKDTRPPSSPEQKHIKT